MFIRKKKISGREYYYVVHSTRIGSKVKKIEHYIGLNKPDGKELDKFRKEFDTIKFYLLTNKKKLEKLKKNYQNFLNTATKDAIRKYEENAVIQFTYDSNRIEGSSMTLKDTKALLLNGITPGEKPLRDIKETENHQKAFFYMKNYKDDIKTDLILELHNILKTGVTQDAGMFRDRGVVVGNLVPVKADMIKIEIKNLFEWYMNNKHLHPIELAAVFHCIFERIHPFFDGNGRVGRLLLNHILMHSGFPLVIIQNKNRRRYYNALRRADDGNYLYMIKLIVAELEHQKKWV